MNISRFFVDKPIFQQNLTPEQRRPRERLISVADGYFDTLQLNDGQLRFFGLCSILAGLVLLWVTS